MSKPGWAGPTETWDQHSRPRARAALNDARKAGWWLKKSSGSAKAWGVITCGDPSLPVNERCSTSILSTSGSHDGSETAEYINKLVRSCPHVKTPQNETDALDAAEELVANARRCLQAAHSLVAARAHRELVEDYLARSEAEAHRADDLLDRALAEEALANEAEAVAAAAATDAGTSVRRGPTRLAELARDKAAEAEELATFDISRRARVLKNHCDDIRNNARSLLAALQ